MTGKGTLILDMTGRRRVYVPCSAWSFSGRIEVKTGSTRRAGPAAFSAPNGSFVLRGNRQTLHETCAGVIFELEL